jgi:hypothetical protein
MEDKTFEELLNTSEVKDFLFRAEKDMFPAMKGSVMSLIIGSDKPDAKLALEIGAAILFDKPLIVMVPRGRKVSAQLRRIADEIIDYDGLDDKTAKQVRAAMFRIIKERNL